MSIGAGALAGICFLAILIFGLLAVRSLTGHIRRSHRPWEGEVNGGVPIDDVAPVADGRMANDGTTVERATAQGVPASDRDPAVGGVEDGRPANGSTVGR